MSLFEEYFELGNIWGILYMIAIFVAIVGIQHLYEKGKLKKRAQWMIGTAIVWLIGAFLMFKLSGGW